MKIFIKNPHFIFWPAIPILLFLGFLYQEKYLSINIYDTYYVFSFIDLMYLISAIFLIIGSGYWFMKISHHQLSFWLNVLNISLTFGGLLLIWVLPRVSRNSIRDYNFNNNLTIIIYVCIFAVILGQLLFPFNIIRGLISKKNSFNH